MFLLNYVVFLSSGTAVHSTVSYCSYDYQNFSLKSLIVHRGHRYSRRNGLIGPHYICLTAIPYTHMSYINWIATEKLLTFGFGFNHPAIDPNRVWSEVLAQHDISSQRAQEHEHETAINRRRISWKYTWYHMGEARPPSHISKTETSRKNQERCMILSYYALSLNEPTRT